MQFFLPRKLTSRRYSPSRWELYSETRGLPRMLQGIEQLEGRQMLSASPVQEFVIEAEDAQHTTGGPTRDGQAWILWANGEVRDTIDIADSGVYQVEVVARGKEAGAELPMMHVKVDKRQLRDPVPVDQNNSEFESYVFDYVELTPGVHEFAVAFVNDYSGGSWATDRDLYVDRIIVRRTDDLLPPTQRFVIEAENAQKTTGGPTSDGKAWKLWANGEIRDTIEIIESGVYDVEVVAMGKEAGSELPKMHVKVDNRQLNDPVGVENNRWSFESIVYRGVELEPGDHKFTVAFVNDYYGGSWAQDRDLYVDKIIVKKTDDLPTQRFVIEAENAQQTTGGPTSDGQAWKIWANGEVYETIEIDSADSGMYEVEVIAMGKEAGMELPKMQLKVDDVPLVDSVEVDSNRWSFESVFFQVELEPGQHRVAVAFTNDYYGGSWAQDRDLYVDRIIVRKDEFDIVVNFTAGITSSQQKVFEQAERRWEEIIVDGMPRYNDGINWIDDLVIEASAVDIDGPGGKLGGANYRELRLDPFLPATGFMEFDTSDLAELEDDGELYDVILHEMGHVLGIGTLWQKHRLLTGVGTSDPRFIGAEATAVYNAVSGDYATGVPVENQGEPGTRDVHWRETVFRNELMTGYFDSPAPLSQLTIASLADLGYTVDIEKADPYVLPSELTAVS